MKHRWPIAVARIVIPFVVMLAISLALGLFLSEKGAKEAKQKQAARNLEYVKQCFTIATMEKQKSQEFLERMKVASTPRQYADLCRESAWFENEIAAKIMAIDATGVSSLQMETTRERVALDTEWARYWENRADIIEEGDAFAQENSGFEPYLRSFMRGLMGDPLGETRDMMDRERDLRKKSVESDAWLKRISDSEQRFYAASLDRIQQQRSAGP